MPSNWGLLRDVYVTLKAYDSFLLDAELRSIDLQRLLSVFHTAIRGARLFTDGLTELRYVFEDLVVRKLRLTFHV